MREIGIRELKASLSRTLHAVEAGDRVRVTFRGRPIADLVPAGAADGDERIRELVAAGRIVAPSASRPGRPPRLAKGSGSASDAVIADRDEER